MEINIENVILHRMAQSEAAAFAVLIAHVRENVMELGAEKDSKEFTEASEASRSEHDNLVGLLTDLEEVAVQSIQKNDGKAVYWISQAAKQMNPLLS